MDKNKLKFVIFGRIIYTDHFINELNKKGFPAPLVIVSLDDEYKRDNRLLGKYGLVGDLEGLASKGLCILHKIRDVNSQECVSLIKSYGGNIGFSINCRNIFKKNIIDLFSDNLFNIHDSYLPNERGGALITWKILNNILQVGNTIHYLDEEIDSGDIVFQNKEIINKKNPIPLDYLRLENKNCERLLSRFLDSLAEGRKLVRKKQDNNTSLYYPRLFTEINGAIDWNWDILSIERFIRGFSDPYPGAWSFYRGKKIHILSSYIEDSEKLFHPFCNGKIVTVFSGKVRVIAGCKALIIDRISVDGNEEDPAQYLSIKYSLYNSNEDLLKSKNYIPTTSEMNL